jgi:predicted dinucleotide-binding enzyme
MRVGVIGSGRIGGNVGLQVGRRGHEVLFSGSRDRAKLEARAAETPGGRAGSAREAVEFGDVVVLSVPWTTVDDVLEQAGSLDGKVVIDTTNQYGRSGLESLPEGVTAIEVNARRMPGALLAKAFNTLTAGYQRDVAEGRVEGEIAMFYANEDEDAGAACEVLIAACGFDPVRIGGWDQAHLLEAPRRDGSVYGEAYAAEDARRIAAAATHDVALAERLANELKLP